MELTRSYERVVPESIRERFDFAEVRNAAAVLESTDKVAFDEVMEVLEAFVLEPLDILFPGGQKSRLALRVDTQFRDKGWREGQHDTKIVSVLRIMPWRRAGEKTVVERRYEVDNPGYKVDNVKGRVALDVEWNAKDGNLDRDVGAYRALYDAGIIDVGVIITRDFDTILGLATRLGRPSPFGGTTTTTLTKLTPRLSRGDAGGCPILAVAITDRRYIGTPETEAEAKRLADDYIRKKKGIPALEGEDEGTEGEADSEPTDPTLFGA